MSSSQVVVVTGATGFLGRHVITGLVRRGHRVRALLRDQCRQVDGVELFPYAGLHDAAGMAAAFAGADLVVHLAARVHIMQETAADPWAEHRRVNVEGTETLLAEATRAGIRRLIMTSSVKAVGEGGTEVWTENTPAAPVDPYGISKLEAERLVLQWSNEEDRDVVVIRLPLVYGPGMRGNMLRLFSIVDAGIPLPLGGVRNRRSLLYVGNLVGALAVLAEAASIRGGVYFLSDGCDLSTPELIRTIGGVLGRPARLLPLPHEVFVALGRLGDRISRIAPFPLTTAAVDRLIGSLAVDSSAFRRVFGFDPPFDPEEGLKVTAQWYRNRRQISTDVRYA